MEILGLKALRVREVISALLVHLVQRVPLEIKANLEALDLLDHKEPLDSRGLVEVRGSQGRLVLRDFLDRLAVKVIRDHKVLQVPMDFQEQSGILDHLVEVPLMGQQEQPVQLGQLEVQGLLVRSDLLVMLDSRVSRGLEGLLVTMDLPVLQEFLVHLVILEHRVNRGFLVHRDREDHLELQEHQVLLGFQVHRGLEVRLVLPVSLGSLAQLVHPVALDLQGLRD